jgi:hypothetical protein
MMRYKHIAEAKSLKTRIKGTVDYYSNKIAVEAARRGVQRAELKGYSHMKSTQGESWATAVNLSKLGQKVACQKNTSC